MTLIPCRRVAAAALVLLPGALAVCAADPPASSVQPYYDFLVAASQGDADAALANFDPQARVVAGPHCTPEAPCVGHAAIRAGYIAPLLAGAAVLPMRAARFDGRQLRTQGECLAAAQRGGHVFEFAGGRIRSLDITLEERAAVPRPAAATVAFSPR
jgi:hypothetical protein